MCGIAGGQGNIDQLLLKMMAKKISHRGPDNIGFYSDDNIHLAHTRLSIIDLSSNSNQPLWDIHLRACVVFNGEIYNYKSLRAELEKEGFVFQSNGDGEVLLNLYIKYGVQAFELLDGIFSFAIWDATINKLVIVRDGFGVKPLYYYNDNNGFYFSSEIKSLLVLPFLKREIDVDSLFRTLVFQWSPGEHTLIKNIRKVPPGTYFIISEGKIEYSCVYWKLPSYQPDTTLSDNEHADKVLDSLKSAVESQMVADVKVGAFLSGGLDSSLVVALAKQCSSSSVNCFTIDTSSKVNDGFVDDLPYAKRVAEHLNVDLNILKVTPDIVNLLPRVVYHLDELQGDPAPLNVLLICEEARRNDIKVLLSGAGGDDLFTGYRRHYAVTLEKYWDWLPRPLRKVISSAVKKLPKNSPLLRRLSKNFQYAELDGDARLLSYFFWIDPLIASDLFLEPVSVDNAFKFIYEYLDTINCDDKVERMLFIEKKFFLVDHNFNYTDKMSMATGVEVRVPFLDKKLTDVASKIPSNIKQKGKVGKAVLKKAAEHILPRNIIYRSKSGFGAPLRDWLKNDLSGLVDIYLSKDNIQKRGIFNPIKIQQLVSDDRSGREDYSYTIFTLLCFEIWCQQFID